MLSFLFQKITKKTFKHIIFGLFKDVIVTIFRYDDKNTNAINNDFLS